MIVFDDVRCARGRQEVLSGVSFVVERGETLALVGRSGAGKSTILKLINRLLHPDAGRVTVDGRDTASWDPIALRRQTGYVLQEVGLFPHMTIGVNVGLVPTLLGWPQDRIERRTRELLELVGLPPDEFAARRPAELSGGQRQRVRGEPFGSLDPITRVELHREFRRIQQQLRKTIVLVTHDMREAFALGDRVGVLSGGHLVACERPSVLQASSHPDVRTLLDAAF